jgi:hypothetical protein
MAASALCLDQESCLRHPRLTRAIINFEKHLPFNDAGEVSIEQPIPESGDRTPLPVPLERF